MPIADKLLHLNETKTVLADAINVALSARGEAPLDANATFRSYAERLFYPGYLFGQGEQGGYYLPPNTETYFTDTAGTTPAALEGAVALVQGEDGPDWTQGTATARPLWAREPEGGRRNLLLNTGLLSDTYWNKRRVTTVVSDTPSPIDSNMMVLVQETIESNVHYLGLSDAPVLTKGAPDCKSIYVAAAGRRRVMLGETGDFGISSWAIYDLVEGVVVSAHASVTPSIEHVKSNIYRISNCRFGPGPFRPFALYIVPDAATSYDARMYEGDGVSGVLLYAPQLEEDTAVTSYQLVESPYNITEAGVPDVPYVRFDLADDVLTTTLPAATYTVALPTRQGIWIDSVEHAGGSFSIGPTSYTGGPAGILTALESDGVCKLIAPPLVIDRALTDAERSALVRWYQSRGAGPELELGPELVVNGDFEDGLKGWRFQPLFGTDATALVNDGVLTIEVQDGTAVNFLQDGMFAANTPYIVNWVPLASLGGGWRLRSATTTAIPPGQDVAVRHSVAGSLILQNTITTGFRSISVGSISVRRIQPKGVA